MRYFIIEENSGMFVDKRPKFPLLTDHHEHALSFLRKKSALKHRDNLNACSKSNRFVVRDSEGNDVDE